MTPWPERIAEGTIALLGAIGVVGIACVYAGLSFHAFLWVLPMAPLLAVALLLLPTGGAVRRDLPAGPPWRSSELAGLLALAVLSATATAVLNRPGGDDAYYLNAVYAHLEHPGLPLLSFDGMHGDPSVPINQVSHRPQIYEIALAWLADRTGISPRTLYWVAVPPLWAALIPLANALVARALAPRLALLQASLAVVLLLLWGDGHRAFGNYAFVRMYQGKGLLVSVAAPLVVWSALRFTRSPSARAWALLALAQVLGVAASSSGLVILPVCAGLALLAGVRGPRDLRVALPGLTASVPILLVLLVVQAEIRTNPLGEEGHVMAWDTLLGDQRSLLVMGLFLVGPAVAWAAGVPGVATWARLVAWSVVLVMNPWSSALAGKVASLFSWRLMWAVPVPSLLALTLAVGGSGSGRVGHLGRLAVAGVLAAFALAGPRTWDDPDLFVGIGRNRVTPRFEGAARAVLERVGPDALVLAPFRVAGRLTNHPGRPRLVAVRDLYVLNLARAFGERGAKERMALLKLVEGRASPAERELALDVLPEWCPDLVVVLEDDGLPRLLRKSGFTRLERTRGYVLFEPSEETCDPSARRR